MELLIHIDGGSRGNPGPAAAGAVLADAGSGRVLAEHGWFLGRLTNNVAEYRGLVRALREAIALGATSVEIASDSQLMVRQINGEYRVKSADLRPHFDEATALLRQFRHWSIRHVYREENRRADELVNLALDRQADANGPALSSNGAQAGELTLDDPPRQRWQVDLAGKSASPCPAGCRGGQQYRIDLTVPAGLCVHAACALFAGGQLVEGDYSCPRCGLEIRVKPRR